LSPRIAFFDLENAPSLGWYYDRYREGNIVADEQDWFLLSFAWQWLDEKKIHCRALCDYPSYEKNKTDDSALVKDLHKLFDDADILIAHNGDRFDRRKANARFLGCGLPPPSPFKMVDTLKTARRQFMLTSNNLGLLRGVYEKLLPWIPNHPDMRIYTGKTSCRNCGSKRVQFRGEDRTLTTVKQRYKCNDCSHWGSTPK
jgi:hypothetical protein